MNNNRQNGTTESPEIQHNQKVECEIINSDTFRDIRFVNRTIEENTVTGYHPEP
ncbi:MAG: hypothetical protein WC186_06700 [Bacteroidales bacterium]